MSADEEALARAAFLGQMRAAHAASAQVTAAFDAMLQAVKHANDPMALVAMNLIIERATTAQKRMLDLSRAVQAAHAPALTGAAHA